MTVKKIVITNRDTTPGQGIDKNQFVKSGDFNPFVDDYNKIIFGKVTTASLTTAAGVIDSTTTVTIPGLTSSSYVVATLTGGTDTSGIPTVYGAIPTTDTLTISVVNLHSTTPLNGTLVISYIIKL